MFRSGSLRGVLGGFVLTAVATGLALWAVILWQSYHAAIKQARMTAERTARVVAEHTRWTLGGADLVLQTTVERLEASGPDGLLASSMERDLLTDKVARMPPGSRLAILDPAGRVLYGSDARADGTHAERPYFTHAVAGESPAITPVAAERVGERPLIAISRRADRAGALAAVALAHLDMRMFAAFYDSLDLPPGSVIALYNRHRQLILREPSAEDDPAADLSGSPLFETWLPAGDSGTREVDAPRRGDTRIVSYRRLPDLELAVEVGLAKAATLADWRRLLQISSVFAAGGLAMALLLTIAAFRSIRARDASGAATAAANAALRTALEQRETLFREMHHRVKNNLQMTASLIRLQARREGDPAVRERLDGTVSRLLSMAAIHEQMQGSESFSETDCSAYLGAVCDALRLTVDGERIQLVTRLEPFVCSMGVAVSLGLIVNEAVTNALRHAFPGERRGTVVVALEREEHRLRLSIEDDGSGLASGDTREGLGSAVIRSMAKNIDADLVIAPRAQGGTRVIVEVDDPTPREAMAAEAPAPAPVAASATLKPA